MEASSRIELLLFSLLLLPLVSWAIYDDPAFPYFTHCLHRRHVNPSYPISEVIYKPNNSSFAAAYQAYVKNSRFVSTPPTLYAIIAARHKSHVQATVVCARKYSIQIRIRSGGHDYEGLSYTSDVPFVILDLNLLKAIKIDISRETAWVRAGATLGELYYDIANKSELHAFPAGVCTTLGTGGHFSGGGYGNLMRKYGLSVDNIIDATIVDVNGRILNRKAMGEDLFWAIRGGGGASFGVILSWKIKLVKVPKRVTVFKVDRSLEEGATDVVYEWQQAAPYIDRDLFIRAMPKVVSVNQTDRKTIKVSFIGFFLGDSDRLVELVRKSFPKLELKKNDTKEVSWLESTVFWAELPAPNVSVVLNRPSHPVISFKSKSDYVKEVIPKEGLESIWKMMIRHGDMWMQWNPYGGFMSDIASNATAFPHRAGNLFKIQYFSLWVDDKIDPEPKLMRLRAVHVGMAPYVSKNPREAFLNYRDIDIGRNPSDRTKTKKAKVYGEKYFKDNYLKLTHVKARVDPGNFFRYEQSIPPYRAP